MGINLNNRGALSSLMSRKDDRQRIMSGVPAGYEAISNPINEVIAENDQGELEANLEIQSKPLLGRTPVGTPKSSWCSRNLCFISSYLILVIAVVVGFLVMNHQNTLQYNDLSSTVRQLQAELASVRQNSTRSYASLHDNVQSFEVSTNSLLSTHTAMLTRLTNGTSNADVLDKLRATQQNVNTQMQSMQSNMQTALTVATNNVTTQLAQTSVELAQTQVTVSKHLNRTILRMEDVVSTATANIYSVQQNVSQQLANMRQSVSETVQTLNAQVDQAQSLIKDEVQTVRDNISQYVAVTNKQFAAENDFVKYQLAGTFTLLGCLISLWHLTSHWRNYSKPDVQRRVMAVLWMVPIYSITSWLSLVIPSAEPFLAAIRDCYEAYAIYTFIALLIAILEDGRGLAELIETITKHVVEERQAVADAIALNNKPPVEHIRPPFPCCYVYHRPTTVAAAWLFQCKLMAMQFVMLKPLLTIIPLILELSGYDLDNIPWVIGESINWRSPKLYILFLQNCSVAVAFWGLLCFYHGTEKDLQWCDPWPKFLCIKGVVFATFWQSLTIQTMSSFGLVDARSASQVQNLLICIEMLIASLAHFYIFPYEEWAEDYKRDRVKGLVLRDTLALRDFVKDMRMMVTSWDTNTSPVKRDGPEEGEQGRGDEEQEEDDEEGHLLKDTSGEGVTLQDIEEGPYQGGYQSSAAALPPHQLSIRKPRNSRADSVDSESGSHKLSAVAERETLETAKRQLMENLQLLAPDQFQSSGGVSSSSGAAAGTHSNRSSYGGGVQSGRPSAGDSEKLSSYLSTEDMPILHQFALPTRAPRESPPKAQHQGPPEGFELLPRFAEEPSGSEAESRPTTSDFLHVSPPVAPLSKESNEERFSLDNEDYSSV